MSPGKMVAQGAHAAHFAADSCRQLWTETYRSWVAEGFKKVVLKVDSLEELESLFEQAKEIHLPRSKITDLGLTEVAPNTVTAIAIGPWESDTIDKITGRLPLL